MKIEKKLFFFFLIYSISVYIRDRQTTGKPDSKKRNRKTGSESAVRGKNKKIITRTKIETFLKSKKYISHQET